MTASSVTDPMGCSFLSYKRERKHEAALLIAAQRDVGIPTWQDVQNLDETHTGTELRRVLSDPKTANAVLWLTPEVKNSEVIKKLEVPMILERDEKGDNFFVIPVVAGGLDYKGVPHVLGSGLTVHDLEEWNLRKVKSDPIDPDEAADVAKLVLRRRIAAIHRFLPQDKPLSINLYTRTSGPVKSNAALTLDWTGRFKGREALSGAWEKHLLPALKTIVETIQKEAPGRSIEASGLAAIPAVTALGRSFLAPRGLRIAWRQYTLGRPEQLWSIEVSRKPSGFKAIESADSDFNSKDLAVLVSVADNVKSDFAASKPGLPAFRAIVHISKPGGDKHDLSNPEEAVDVALVVIDEIRKARKEFRPIERIHLFMAVPVGLAMMIGQLMNTLGLVQTYEYIAEEGCYHSAALLEPSS